MPCVECVLESVSSMYVCFQKHIILSRKKSTVKIMQVSYYEVKISDNIIATFDNYYNRKDIKMTSLAVVAIPLYIRVL